MTALALTVVLAALTAVAGAASARESVASALFRVTFTANVSASATYVDVEDRGGPCKVELTGGNSSGAWLESRGAAFASANRIQGLGVVVDGALPVVRGHARFSPEATFGRPTECDFGDQPPPPIPPSVETCEPPPPLPIRALHITFHSTDAGRLTLEPVRHAVFGLPLVGCGFATDSEAALGNLDPAVGRFSPTRLLNPRVRRVVVVGEAETTADVAGPSFAGSVRRQIRWQLTFRRVRASG